MSTEKTIKVGDEVEVVYHNEIWKGQVIRFGEHTGMVISDITKYVLANKTENN